MVKKIFIIELHHILIVKNLPTVDASKQLHNILIIFSTGIIDEHEEKMEIKIIALVLVLFQEIRFLPFVGEGVFNNLFRRRCMLYIILHVTWSSSGRSFI